MGDSSKAALVIIDNFKRQITDVVNALIEANDINVRLLPPNTTDLFQPLDVAVNKPFKDFLKQKFELWYADKVMEQLQSVEDVQSVEIQPIDLSFSTVKISSAKWLVEASQFLAENPQSIVNGFRHTSMFSSLIADTAYLSLTLIVGCLLHSSSSPIAVVHIFIYNYDSL